MDIGRNDGIRYCTYCKCHGYTTDARYQPRLASMELGDRRRCPLPITTPTTISTGNQIEALNEREETEHDILIEQFEAETARIENKKRSEETTAEDQTAQLLKELEEKEISEDWLQKCKIIRTTTTNIPDFF